MKPTKFYISTIKQNYAKPLHVSENILLIKVISLWALFKIY